MTEAVEKLEEEKRQQEAAGRALTSSVVDCGECGADSVHVSRRNQGTGGPVPLDGYVTHMDGGTAYYHPEGE